VIFVDRGDGDFDDGAGGSTVGDGDVGDAGSAGNGGDSSAVKTADCKQNTR